MRKHTMKALCLILLATILVSFAGCSSRNVEGKWICNEGDEPYGYRFEELGTTKDGEKMGRAYCVPSDSSYLFNISYYYSFVDDDTIQITQYAPSFSSNGGVSLEGEEYDVLQIKSEDGQRVMISEESGTKFYFEENK